MKKVPDWLKQAIVVVLAVGGMLTWFSQYHVPALIDSHVLGLVKDVTALQSETTSLGQNLSKTDSKVDGLLQKLVDAELKRTTRLAGQEAGAAKETLEFLADVLGEAKEAGISPDPQKLADAGRKAIALTRKAELREPAQRVVSQLIDYRSFLNEAESPAPAKAISQQQASDLYFKYEYQPLKETTNIPALFIGELVPMTEAARFQPLLGARPSTGPLGPKYLMLEGAGFRFKLDGYYLKNVVLRNAHIVYRGGPVRLDGVYFVNCVFEFEDSRATNDLRLAILSKPSVAFSAG